MGDTAGDTKTQEPEYMRELRQLRKENKRHKIAGTLKDIEISSLRDALTRTMKEASDALKELRLLKDAGVPSPGQHANPAQKTAEEIAADTKKATDEIIFNLVEKTRYEAKNNESVLQILGATLRGEDEGQGAANARRLMECYQQLNSSSMVFGHVLKTYNDFFSLLKKALKIILQADVELCIGTAADLMEALGPDKSTNELVQAATVHSQAKGFTTASDSK
jgi:hypothetical protein